MGEKTHRGRKAYQLGCFGCKQRNLDSTALNNKGISLSYYTKLYNFIVFFFLYQKSRDGVVPQLVNSGAQWHQRFRLFTSVILPPSVGQQSPPLWCEDGYHAAKHHGLTQLQYLMLNRVSGSLLSTLDLLSMLIHITTLWGRNSHWLDFTDRYIRAQRD